MSQREEPLLAVKAVKFMRLLLCSNFLSLFSDFNTSISHFSPLLRYCYDLSISILTLNRILEHRGLNLSKHVGLWLYDRNGLLR